MSLFCQPRLTGNVIRLPYYVCSLDRPCSLEKSYPGPVQTFILAFKIIHKIIVFNFFLLKSLFQKREKKIDFKKKNYMKAGAKGSLELDKDTQASKKLNHNLLFFFRLLFSFHWLHVKKYIYTYK